jgi:hypothetical protein
MRKLPLIIFALSFSLFSHVFAQEFVAYEGKNAIKEGEGGAKKTIDGVDFWSDGTPPYKFKIVGFITDRRHKTGLVGMFRMSNLESDIAEIAKNQGGDAVISISSESEVVGGIGQNFGTATGSATTMGGVTTGSAMGTSSMITQSVQKQNSKYMLVKYLKD